MCSNVQVWAHLCPSVHMTAVRRAGYKGQGAQSEVHMAGCTCTSGQSLAFHHQENLQNLKVSIFSLHFSDSIFPFASHRYEILY